MSQNGHGPLGQTLLIAEPVSEEAAYPIVLVVWHDAWFDFDQQDAEDCAPDYLVQTVGFLIGENPTHVSVAQEILPNGDGFRAVTHVPRRVIEGEVRVLPVAVLP